MANRIIQTETLTGIADAIRQKTGGTNTMTPAQMAAAISGIETGATPTGTRQIRIAQNGTTTEDVADYANAEIIVAVPNEGISKTLLCDDTAEEDVAAIICTIPEEYRSFRYFMISLVGSVSANEWIYPGFNGLAATSSGCYFSQRRSFNDTILTTKSSFNENYILPGYGSSSISATEVTSITFRLYNAASRFNAGFHVRIWGVTP